MLQPRVYQWLNWLGLIIVLVVNTLANALPINGQDSGEVSDKYANLFVPAGYTFSIWGLIYLLLLAFAVYQSRGMLKGDPPAFVRDIGPWFFISCLANSSWLFAWHYELLSLSVLIMLVLLSALLIIFVRLDAALPVAGRSSFWLVYLPFSVYLGWICIATIANMAAWLTSLGWDGGGISPRIWTVAMILTGATLGLWFLWKRRNVPLALVVCWAFGGIFSRQRSLGPPSDDLILYTLVICLVLLLLSSILRLPAWLARR